MKRKRSIVRKITFLLLTLSLVPLFFMGAIGIAGLYSMQGISRENSKQLGKMAASDAEQALEEAAAAQLQAMTVEKAAYIEERFHEVAAYVHGIAAEAEAIYEMPEKYPDRETPRPVKGSTKLAAQLLWSKELTNPTPEQKAELLKLGNLQDLLVRYNTNNDMISSVHIATASGWVIVADDKAANKYAEDATTPYTIEAKEREWYQLAEKAEPGQVVYTDIIEDIYKGGKGIICAKPVYLEGTMVAVAGAGLYLDTINETILNTGIGETGYTFLINKNGKILVSPQKKGETAPHKGNEDLRKSENESLANVANAVLRGETGMERMTIDEKEVYIAYVPLEDTGWGLLAVMDMEEAFAPAMGSQQRILQLSETVAAKQEAAIHTMQMIFSVIFVVSAIAVSLGGMWFGKKIANPIHKLTEDVDKLDGGNLEYRIEVHTGDEIEELAVSFNNMTTQLRGYIENLANITAEKERSRAELSLAGSIQADMLPDVTSACPGREEFTIAASMTPAKSVGGDFYDFFLLDQEHIALVVADVSGKGVPAALFMSMAKIIIRSQLKNTETLAETVAKINTVLCANNPSGMFVTAWIGILHITTGKLVFVNAGHCHPLLKRKNGQYEYLTQSGGFVLAGMEDMVYQKDSILLQPGDFLFQYSDGVIEANNEGGDLYGEERLKQCLNDTAEEMPEKVLEQAWKNILTFQGEAEQFDDVTMLALCYHGSQGVLWIGKAEIEQITEVMAFVEEALKRHHFSLTDSSKILVAVDEIFSNICYYSGASEVKVQCIFHGEKIVVTFTDDGTPYNPLDRPNPDIGMDAEKRSIGGLGIYLVKETMDCVNYKYAEERNHLTIEKQNGQKTDKNQEIVEGEKHE